MKVRSSIEPAKVEITPNYILVSSNITPYEEIIDGHVMSGYEYDCEKYTKDEYILLLAQELEAAKILLGVE